MLRRLISSSAVICAATAVAVSVAVAAPRLLADLTGKWTVNIATPDQARTSVMTLTQKGDSISGTTESGELGVSPLKGVVKGDSVLFGFAIDMGGQQIIINASAVMKGEHNMEGLFDVSGMGAFPFNAARQP